MAEIDPRRELLKQATWLSRHGFHSRKFLKKPDLSESCGFKDFPNLSCAAAPFNSEERIDKEESLYTRSARRIGEEQSSLTVSITSLC
jgi:hypothetical protein